MRIIVQNQPRQIVHYTLSQKNTSQERVGGVAQGVGPEFKLQYDKNQTKNHLAFVRLHGLRFSQEFWGKNVPSGFSRRKQFHFLANISQPGVCRMFSGIHSSV
jgi:hypothetical protein